MESISHDCSSLLIHLNRHCGILRLLKNAVSAIYVVQTGMIVECIYRILCRQGFWKRQFWSTWNLWGNSGKYLKNFVGIADGKTKIRVWDLLLYSSWPEHIYLYKIFLSKRETENSISTYVSSFGHISQAQSYSNLPVHHSSGHILNTLPIF